MAKPRTRQPTQPAVPAPQRQMSIAFESPLIQAMTAAERASALTALTNLLLQAAGVPAATGAHDDGR